MLKLKHETMIERLRAIAWYTEEIETALAQHSFSEPFGQHRVGQHWALTPYSVKAIVIHTAPPANKRNLICFAIEHETRGWRFHRLSHADWLAPKPVPRIDGESAGLLASRLDYASQILTPVGYEENKRTWQWQISLTCDSRLRPKVKLVVCRSGNRITLPDELCRNSDLIAMVRWCRDTGEWSPALSDWLTDNWPLFDKVNRSAATYLSRKSRT